MSIREKTPCVLISALLASWLFVSPAYSGPITPQHFGSVVYVTGGVGDGEIAVIKQMMQDYPLSMTFTEMQNGSAVFLADVPVTVRTAHGDSVLDVRTNGPYLLVKLPAGTYEVSASDKGRTETRSVTVTDHSHARLVFEWH